MLDRFPRRPGGELVLCEQGFVDVLADGSARPVAWTEVYDFRGLSTRNRVTVAYIPVVQVTTHRFEVRMVTGGSVVVDKSVDRVRELADTLESATTRHRIHHRLGEIQRSGHTRMSDQFPAITITPDAVFDQDRLLFPHTAVESFDAVKKGGTRVTYRDQRGGRRYLHLPADKLDVRVTVTLIDGFRRQVRQ